jgi:hypothetical protein
LASFTFSFNRAVRNRLMEFITRVPARWLRT